MLDQNLNHRLGPEDYAFLLMETENEPMNIGSIAIFDGDVPVRDFVQNIASKLHLIPRYTQVVVPAPLNVGRPTWEADPHFDIHRHIHEAWLEAPGDIDQLKVFAAEVFGRPLDRTKPLWEVYLVKGLADGNTALVTTIHHCMVDGVGGVELAMVMLDTVPNPQRVAYSAVERTPLPRPEQLFTDALIDDAGEMFDHWIAWQKRFIDLFDRASRGWARGMRRGLEAALPYFAVPVKKASFNQKIGPGREIAVAPFSLEWFRALKARTGGTINDLALSIVGAAVGRYMAENGEAVSGRTLRVLTPVNVRRADQQGRLGNHISMLLAEVPLWEMDPLQRLETVSSRMSYLKSEHAGDGVEMVADELLSLPTPLLKALTAFGAPPNTVANMICTNVPGPTIPLYTVGHRLLAHWALVPLAWEMGLGCAVTSYEDAIAFTLVADPDSVEDVERIAEYLRDAAAELAIAAGLTREVTALVDVTVTEVTLFSRS